MHLSYKILIGLVLGVIAGLVAGPSSAPLLKVWVASVGTFFINLIKMIIVPVVSLFTPKPDKELVDSAFACYEKETEVPQKTALGK